MDIVDPLIPPQPVDFATKPSLSFHLYSDEDGEVTTDVEGLERPSRSLALGVLLQQKQFEEVQDPIEVELTLPPLPVDSATKPSLPFHLYLDEEVTADVEDLEDPSRALALQVLLQEKQEAHDLKVEVCNVDGGASALNQSIAKKPRPTIAPHVADMMSKRSTRSKQFKHKDKCSLLRLVVSCSLQNT